MKKELIYGAVFLIAGGISYFLWEQIKDLIIKDGVFLACIAIAFSGYFIYMEYVTRD